MAMIWRSYQVEPLHPLRPNQHPLGNAIGWGRPRLSDAQLIDGLDAGDERLNAATRTGELQRLAKMIGLGTRMVPRTEAAALRQALRRGEHVIATGDTIEIGWPRHAAHYVLVNREMPDGSIEVLDPGRDRPWYFSIEQVIRFSSTKGGYLMAVGPNAARPDR
jgi:hypothetical protein